MSPDDECSICGTTRDMHGDRNHRFNMDGVLLPLEKGPKPRQEAPKLRSEATQAGVEKPDAHAALLRMTEVLITKGVLDARDVLYILGGSSS